jgi:hypothetical protein
MIDNPTTMIPKIRAEFSLVELLRETDPESAVKLLEEIESRNSVGSREATQIRAGVERQAMRERGEP